MSKPKAPKPPDPYKVAEAQTKTNIDTAKNQAQLAMTNTTGPQGSVSYATDPNSPSGYSQTTTMDPASQALLTQLQGLKGSSMTGLADATSQPFDLNAAGASKISDLQRTMLDPLWDQREKANETDLLNRGIRPGSEQYDNMTRQFGQTRDDAYNKMFLDAFSQANNAAIQQREVPINDYLRISGLANPAQPNTPATPTPGVAPTDLSGDVYNSANMAQTAYNNQMGGMYGLGGAFVGAAGRVASNPASLALLGLGA